MQESISILLTPLPEKLTPILYSSKLHPQSSEQVFTANIHADMITIGQKFIPFSFQLRFSVREKELSLFYGQSQYNFFLPNDDHVQWRNFLKIYLNQKGFHEQFKAIKKIGQGSFASVYLVKKIQDGQQYAVKAFSKQAAYSEENGKQCLMKQVDIMRKLSHKNNMKLYQVFESENSLYLVFELLQGGMLYDKIKAKIKFKPLQIKSIIHGLLEGLRQMHSKNIMHRDLKPQNILMRNQNDCVIADYGLAEYVDAQKYLFTRCGTPGYVAPQVINITDMTTKYSSICDIFSLGLIFHVLLFGQSVFKGKTYNQVLKQNRSCQFVLEGRQYQTVSHQTLDLLTKMLRKNPEERITAEQAIAHPFFKNIQQDQDQKLDVVTDLKSSVLQQKVKNRCTQQSPILTTANQKRKQNKMIKKDSCISFKMGRDPTFNGKTQTLQNLNEAKLSGFGGQVLKVKSKFQRKENQ